MGADAVAVLGGSGMAGREGINWFDVCATDYELAVVTGSPNTEGEDLGDVWRRREQELADRYRFWDPAPCPGEYADMTIQETNPDLIAEEARYALSALPGDEAEEMEPALRERGVHVISNASTFRGHHNIPIVVPEVSWGKEAVEVALERQDTRGAYEGKQLNGPNCSTRAFVSVIDALERADYRLSGVEVETRQALSGAGGRIRKEGYWEHYGRNIEKEKKFKDWGRSKHPCFDTSEEMKTAWEPQKVLGRCWPYAAIDNAYRSDSVASGHFLPVRADTYRVARQDGHLAHLTLTFEESVDVEEVESVLDGYAVPDPIADCPTAPGRPIHVKDTINPGEDVSIEEGMATVVGDIAQKDARTITLDSFSHNRRAGAMWNAGFILEAYQEILS